MRYLFLSVACLLLGGAGALAIRRYAVLLDIVDVPNARSSHTAPVPKGGGIGILLAFAVSSVVLGMPWWLWVPAGALSLVSFQSDRVDLSLGVRLPVQFLAAGCVVIAWYGTGGGVKDFASSLPFPLVAALVIFLAVFIVGTANFYNFMDGINGIAGMTGIVAFGLLAMSAYLSGEPAGVITICTCMCLACLGFLPFNIPKARVFMGDVGSVLLGFVFALMVMTTAHDITGFLALAACLFPFYADELTTMFVRIKDGERLSKPHRRHLYQLLANEMGIAHWKVSLWYGVLQLLVGCSALVSSRYGFMAVAGSLCFYFVGFSFVSYHVRVRIPQGNQ